MSDPFELLGLTYEATPKEVHARFVELSKTHHPDHGGQLEAFQQLKEAHDEALGLARQPRMCPGEGCIKGKVATRQGFNTTWKACPTCGGKGKVVLE